jgi:hypothetical protein
MLPAPERRTQHHMLGGCLPRGAQFRSGQLERTGVMASTSWPPLTSQRRTHPRTGVAGTPLLQPLRVGGAKRHGTSRHACHEMPRWHAIASHTEMRTPHALARQRHVFACLQCCKGVPTEAHCKAEVTPINTGVAAAILPTSSSACIMRLMREANGCAPRLRGGMLDRS